MDVEVQDRKRLYFFHMARSGGDKKPFYANFEETKAFFTFNFQENSVIKANDFIERCYGLRQLLCTGRFHTQIVYYWFQGLVRL